MNELDVQKLQDYYEGDIRKKRKARRGKHFPDTIACFGHGGFAMTYSSEFLSALGRKAWQEFHFSVWQRHFFKFGYCWNHCPRINK